MSVVPSNIPSVIRNHYTTLYGLVWNTDDTGFKDQHLVDEMKNRYPEGCWFFPYHPILKMLPFKTEAGAFDTAREALPLMKLRVSGIEELTL